MNVEQAPTLPLTLAEARDLAERREWRLLAERAAGQDDARLIGEPELAYHCADAFLRTGSAARGLALIREVEPFARLGGDRRLSLRTTNLLGALLFEAGTTAESEERFLELLERASEWKDDEFAARASNNLGVLANLHGEREKALTFYQRALASYQRLGYTRGLAQTHYNLGMAYRQIRFPDEAETHYANAIRYAQEAGTEDVIGLAESDRGLLSVENGDATKGEVLARRARDRFIRLADPVRTAEATRVLAAALHATGMGDEALELLAEARSAAENHSNLLLRSEIDRDSSRILASIGDLAGARASASVAIEGFARLGARNEVESLTTFLESLPG